MASRKFLYTDAAGLYQESAGAYESTDLNSTATGNGAALIGLEDAGGYTSATSVEDAIQELYLRGIQQGVTYTAETDISKGFPVFISSADSASQFDDLTSGKRVIGLAFEDALETEDVIVTANDSVVYGCLSAATPGDVYYWNGSALSTAMPATSGSHVWEVGSAKNATDLHVDVRFVKVNA